MSKQKAEVLSHEDVDLTLAYYSLNMRMSYPSWGSVLTTFLLVTSFSSVNTSTVQNDVRRHHDQLHRVLPAGAANSFVSDARFDSDGQGTPPILDRNIKV